MRCGIVIIIAHSLLAARRERRRRRSPPTPPHGGRDAVGPRSSSLTGGGYGHGVGLSQYGALAQAQAGRSFARSSRFYYPGTQLGDGARPPRCESSLRAAAEPRDRLDGAVHGPRRHRDDDGAPRRRARRSAAISRCRSTACRRRCRGRSRSCPATARRSRSTARATAASCASRARQQAAGDRLRRPRRLPAGGRAGRDAEGWPPRR